MGTPFRVSIADENGRAHLVFEAEIDGLIRVHIVRLGEASRAIYIKPENLIRGVNEFAPILEEGEK